MLKKLKAYWKYFWYILEHKKNLIKGARDYNVGMHKITHDLSKFSPKEFFAYAHYFYIDKDKYKDEFDKAWEHHYQNNKHHWDYWVDKETGIAKSMSDYAIRCMLSDWTGMSIKFGDTPQHFYLNNYRRMNLEYNTRLNVEAYLNLNDSMYHNYGHTLEDFAKKYEEDHYNNYFGYIKDKYGIDTYKLLKPVL